MQYKYTIFPTKGGWVGALFSLHGLYRLTLPCETESQAKWCLLLDEFLEIEQVEQIGTLHEELERYFAGESVVFHTPVDWSGYTVFQRQVLEYITSISYGQVAAYGNVAKEIGRAKAYRAVGQALHINRTPIVVPCHRVLASGGKIGGFAGGIECKQKLLDLERISYRT